MENLVMGTIEHINHCQYQIDTARNPAVINRWKKIMEESEYQAYANGLFERKRNKQN